MIPSVLIVDDEQAFLHSVVRKLRLDGYEDLTATAEPAEALRLAQERSFDVALLDITMPGMNGLELLEQVKERSPQTECIMVTALEEIPSVIRAVKLGAFDYLVKPLRPDQLLLSLERALERKRMLQVLLLRGEEAVEATLDNPAAFADIVTCNESMLRLLREAELHSGSDIPVLITGETGVGKELLAASIHRASMRSKGPFVAVNMLSLSPSLFESEFFGHAKGSFTGANQDKQGYLSRARGGTLFLDEIGDLPLEIQGKLLRILQEREFTPVGRTRPERADTRFVAATNQNLEALVEQGTFRKDLYYRLRFACLDLPPLRQRKDDIRLLAAHFLQATPCAAVLSEAAAVRLVEHDWPGNVRELKGVIEAACNLAAGRELQPEHLNLPHNAASSPAADNAHGAIEALAEVERRHILNTYEALGNNKTHTARELGISLATLQRKLKAYGVR